MAANLFLRRGHLMPALGDVHGDLLFQEPALFRQDDSEKTAESCDSQSVAALCDILQQGMVLLGALCGSVRLGAAPSYIQQSICRLYIDRPSTVG